jgi:hypothetical protein
LERAHLPLGAPKILLVEHAEILAVRSLSLNPVLGAVVCYDRTQGATGWTDGALDWPAVFIKLLVALVTKQLGAQVMEWLFAAVVWGASDEVRRMAAPQRMAPAPMLLVAMAE